MRRQADWPWPRVMAHRCGGALAPENTLPGLQVCVMTGCRGVEFDVMLSGSGTPILMHDETLERTTTGSGPVSLASDAQLALLDAGVRHHRAFAGTAIPAFAATIEQCRLLDLAANVEIKPAAGYERETGAAAAQMAELGWSGAAVLPLLSSFSEVALEAARITAPRLPRGLLVDQLPADWRARCERLDVIAVHLNQRLLDQATVATLRGEGYRVLSYTVNDPLRARQLLDWGVDTVVTDRPDSVRA
ncbi:MAG: glycerophosphodiester phosphodiesterase [Moraxellaceae bacterium]|nr:glycerophosphodiester phosphodiesterase [Moraxellaceae bacterium]